MVVSFSLALTFPLGLFASDSAWPPLDLFSLCFSSESDSASLLTDSRLEKDVAAPPLDVDGAALCPSSTKLMSSGETWALTPKDQVGCLNFLSIVDPQQISFKKNVSEHLIHWKAQRIGVMKAKVTTSSPSSSTVASREVSNCLNRSQSL